MKHLIALLLLFGMGRAGTDSLLARAENQFFNRHLNRTWLDSAYAVFASVIKAEPGNEHCLYLWSRIHIQKGDDARQKRDKLRYFIKAKSIAEELIDRNDRSALGHCWWGVAQGRVGQTRGVLNSLFMVSGLKRAFNRAVELDSGCATAWDALGVLYYELPGFAGGNLARSEEYFLRSIRADPNYALPQLDLAKVYTRQKRWADARRQLNELLAISEPTYPGDFTLDDKPEAVAMLKQIANK